MSSLHYNPIVVGSDSTVVAEFISDGASVSAYQSEAELESEFVALLQSQAYEYLPITSEAQLIANLRTQIEKLNSITFSNSEWEQFFRTSIAGANDGVAEKTVRIQEDFVQILKRDDGSSKNVVLIDKKDIHNNSLQVINQYEIAAGSGGAKRSNRYDETVLVNGLPLVHIELKRRGIDIREAFNQINRYQRDSFWAGSGLFDYVQLFVISNGTLTKYYSNTTRRQHLEEINGVKRNSGTSNSFEFTSWWADATNKPIPDLTHFTKTFFAKHALLNILTKYCVLTADKMLLVMRPYQIVATERVMQKIDISVNYHQLGTVTAGGYVWHTTGSGKTLTSFKAAQLASKLHTVGKVLFIVDRKDLDYQTMREYDRFEKGAANSNTSTTVLKRQLEDPNAKIIITTIQKLSSFINANKGHAIYSDHVVLIFDECHRSQFGDMHSAIIKSFKQYNIFGFTGTPIFTVNSRRGGGSLLKTTVQAFGCYLHGDVSNCPPTEHRSAMHTYTIVDAIYDKNVLPFRVEYFETIKELTKGAKVGQIDSVQMEKAFLHPERIRQIVAYTLEHFDQKTKRADNYGHSVITNVTDVVVSKNKTTEVRTPKRVNGFNALFAVASIEAARHYYSEFKRQQEELPPGRRLKIATIFSYAVNEDIGDDYLDEEGFETNALDRPSRDFLDDAIVDYNAMFGTSYDTSAAKFQNYYKDLSLRMKNREVDLVIVVNMFLTGFDATTLNTLFVDKTLVNHGLIQAYSRTNRILNSIKTYGNIVTFRDLQKETNDAIALFGNEKASGIVLLKPYDYYYEEYAEKVKQLFADFPLDTRIVGEKAQKKFITLFGAILRLQNILTSFDDFMGDEILSQRQDQDYRSVYLNLHAELRKESEANEESDIGDDIVFEIELIKQVEINVDYILMLVAKERKARGDGAPAETDIKSDIHRAIDSSPTLRNKKDLILSFVESVSEDGKIDDEWRDFVIAKRTAALDDLIAKHNLKPEESKKFVATAFRDGVVPTSGTAITKILPPVTRFSAGDSHGEAKERVLTDLADFFERFFDLSGDGAKA
jgi:type I restriction enzyme R subunit